MNYYMKEFLKLNCHRDVIHSISNLSKLSKEITESMAIIKRLKGIVPKNPNKYNIIDLCAGNALTSVLAAHLLPIKFALAIDKQKRKGQYDDVRKFRYNQEDVTNFCPLNNDILIAVHPCKTADIIVDIFNSSNAYALIMMPCCDAFFNDVLAKSWLHRKLSAYDLWTYHLAQKIKGAKVTIHTDKFVESPKNNIIVAIR